MARRLLLRPAAVAVLAAAVVLVASAPAARAQSPAADDAPEYRNHTVGGADGWFFDAAANATSGNYSGWANGETFYLGDYLIFKTNDNSSVVQTTNATTYNLCDPSDDPDTSIYGGGGGGGGGLEQNNTIPVALIVEGTNYFFSDADGGAQCQQGMRFQIKVQHGQGLPPSLRRPRHPYPLSPAGHSSSRFHHSLRSTMESFSRSFKIPPLALLLPRSALPDCLSLPAPQIPGVSAAQDATAALSPGSGFVLGRALMPAAACHSAECRSRPAAGLQAAAP